MYFYKLAFSLEHYQLMWEYLAWNLKAVKVNILVLLNLWIYGNWCWYVTYEQIIVCRSLYRRPLNPFMCRNIGKIHRFWHLHIFHHISPTIMPRDFIFSDIVDKSMHFILIDRCHNLCVNYWLMTNYDKNYKILDNHADKMSIISFWTIFKHEQLVNTA